MNRTLIVANWKMHLNTQQASLLVHRLDQRIKIHRDIEIVLAPSMLSLQPLSLQIDRRKFRLAAQDAYYKDEGPYTGEVSFTMLRDLVHYCIVGHSGRRIYFNESLEVVRDKVQAAVRNKIIPILCVGETKQERAAGETKRVIHDQLTTALANLTTEDIRDIVIAYEPVWAVSTFDGVISKPYDMQKSIDFIRYEIKELYGEAVSQEVRVLYGGSVNDQDARAYMVLNGCDGLIVGAASLNYEQFTGIVDSAYRMLHERDNE
jgi:triosephosphate isomerase (TIM)